MQLADSDTQKVVLRETRSGRLIVSHWLFLFLSVGRPTETGRDREDSRLLNSRKSYGSLPEGIEIRNGMFVITEAFGLQANSYRSLWNHDRQHAVSYLFYLTRMR